jgi:hypothetical protein
MQGNGIAKCGFRIANFVKDEGIKIRNSHFAIRNQPKDLPMINDKKTSELIETSLIYLLSAAVAAAAFVLVWLISSLLGFGRA